MSVLYLCPACNAIYSMPARLKGQTFACVRCQAEIYVSGKSVVDPIRVKPSRSSAAIGFTSLRKIATRSIAIKLYLVPTAVVSIIAFSLVFSGLREEPFQPSHLIRTEQNRAGEEGQNQGEKPALAISPEDVTPLPKRPRPAINVQQAVLSRDSEEVDSWQIDASLPEPSSDSWFDSRPRDGRGELSISNGTQHSAVVRLAEIEGEREYLWYVKSGRIELSGIEDGVYGLQFCIGDGWRSVANGGGVPNRTGPKNDVSDRASVNEWFITDHGCSEFDRRLPFATRIQEDGIEYSVHEVTLHEVLAGNTRMLPISKTKFLRPFRK